MTILSMTFILLCAVQVEQVNVVTSLTTYGSIAEAIVGDRGSVTAIAEGDEDPHFVQPKPSFVALLRDADLFVTTGLDLELWVPALLDRAGNRGVSPGGPGYVTASAGIQLLEVPPSVDRSAGDVHVYGNPHIHTDPLNAILIARNILEGLLNVAPENTEYFTANEQRFEREILEALIGKELVEILTPATATQLLESNQLYDFLNRTPYQGSPLAGRLGGWFEKAAVLRGRDLICYRKEWSYFGRRFGIPCTDYIEPKTGIPPTPRHVRKLIDLMREREIPAIFAASYSSQSQIARVAERTGSEAVIVAQNTRGAPGIDSYFDLIDSWIVQLARVYAEAS